MRITTACILAAVLIPLVYLLANSENRRNAKTGFRDAPANAAQQIPLPEKAAEIVRH